MSRSNSSDGHSVYKLDKHDPEVGPTSVHVQPEYRTESAAENDGESFDNVPKANRRLGTLSATMLIANRMIGTGIFATPGSFKF